MENYIEIYNPRNAAKLTPEQIAYMAELTNDQIGELAKEYPNQPTGNAYLRYFMKGEPVDRQRYPLGTWANLHSLRKLGREDIIPAGFKANAPVYNRKATIVNKKATRVIDLGDNEIIPGMVSKPVVSDAVEVTDVKENEAVTEAQDKLDEAIKSGAHPNTVNKLKRKLEEVKKQPTT